MFDPYDYLKIETAKLLRSSVYSNALPIDIKCCSTGFELNTPLPLIVKADACQWAKAISSSSSQLFSSVEAVGGHICFSLSDKAYSCCLDSILREATPLDALSSFESKAEYTYMRMLMLSRNKNSGFICDDSIKRALWLSFALVGKKSNAALNAACDAALAIGNPKSRFLLKKQCGSIGTCIASLIYRRLNLQ